MEELSAVEMIGVRTGVVAISQSNSIKAGNRDQGRGNRKLDNPPRTESGVSQTSRGQSLGLFAHLGCALDLVPVERLAVDGALESFGEHDGEDLAISKALQPDVKEQPAVAFVGGVASFEAEGDGRGNEVDEQKRAEVREQLFEAGGRSGLRMVVAIDEVVRESCQKHQVDEGRNERKEHLEDEDIG